MSAEAPLVLGAIAAAEPVIRIEKWAMISWPVDDRDSGLAKATS